MQHCSCLNGRSGHDDAAGEALDQHFMQAHSQLIAAEMRLRRLEVEVSARSDASKRLLQLMDKHRAEELAIRDTAHNVYSEMEVYKAAAESHSDECD